MRVGDTIDGWTVDKIHPCGSARLVRADGAVTTKHEHDERGQCCPQCRQPLGIAVMPNAHCYIRCGGCGHHWEHTPTPCASTTP